MIPFSLSGRDVSLATTVEKKYNIISSINYSIQACKNTPERNNHAEDVWVEMAIGEIAVII